MEFSQADWEKVLAAQKRAASVASEQESAQPEDPDSEEDGDSVVTLTDIEPKATFGEEEAALEVEEAVEAEEADLVTEEEAPREVPVSVFRPVAAVSKEIPAAEGVSTAEEQDKKTMSVFEWMEAAIFALVAISLIFALVIRTVGVDGRSMNNTLLDGDKLLLSSYYYVPQRGDIVVINRYTDEPLIKRVIAVAGDTLDIDATTGQVILNGKVLDEPYLDCTTPREGFIGEVVVPAGHLFVMGDNRGDSHDSRAADIGFVEEADVMGKALFRVAPFSEFGSIYSY